MTNKNLPKAPMIWIDGRRVAFKPKCIECGDIAEVSSPKGWIYEDGYICPKCQLHFVRSLPV